MKRTFLFASAALVALAASAQYDVDPSTSVVLDGGPVASVDYLVLSEGAINDFKAKGAAITDLGPNDTDRFLYIWSAGETLIPSDSSNPRVDLEEGGYVSFEVSTYGWSGAGFCIVKEAPVNLSHFNDDTHFHMAYMTPSGNGPASIAITLLSDAAKFSIGDAFNDNGAIFPTIAPKITDEWQGIDISFADLKKVWPAWNFNNQVPYEGNIMAFLGGGVAGQTFAFDAVYFYNRTGAAVNEINNDAEGFVVTDKTVNAINGNGIELYGLDGKLVKSTASATLGLNNLANGVYVVRCGSKTQKVVVR